MTIVLVLDTATPAITAALASVTPTGVELLATGRNISARAHGELLAPLVTGCFAEAGVSSRDLGAIVAGIGPGPFTGLRVGLVTAAAMGHALDLPTYGVCSLDGLGLTTSAATLVATDARRKEVYWAVYRDGARRTEPAVEKPAAVAPQLAALGVTAAVGGGAALYADVWGLGAVEARDPEPLALAQVAADRVRAGAPSETLTPLYLRRPDAAEPHAPKPVRA